MEGTWPWLTKSTMFEFARLVRSTTHSVTMGRNGPSSTVLQRAITTSSMAASVDKLTAFSPSPGPSQAGGCQSTA